MFLLLALYWKILSVENKGFYAQYDVISSNIHVLYFTFIIQGKFILSWMKGILRRNQNTKTDVEAINFSSPSALKNRQTHTAHTETKVWVRKS
jgi:hypothetical protein